MFPHYSVNTINNFTCNFNRGNPINDLFILNHFVTDANLGYGLYTESDDVSISLNELTNLKIVFTVMLYTL